MNFLKESFERVLRWKGDTMEIYHASSTTQNGTAETLVRSCKLALKKVIGEHVLAPFELYTCLLEVANFDKKWLKTDSKTTE